MSEKDDTDCEDIRSDLTDGRPLGNWKSRYCREAWIQICCEMLYLILLLAFCSIILLFIALSISGNVGASEKVELFYFDFTVDERVLRWASVALAGMLGGITFDMKWLYHSVAKHLWNRDRLLWRLIVPLNSSLVALFFAFMIVSGIVPFIKNESFKDLYFGLGFGFLFGYFSDNVLAALQNFAQRTFGTTKPSGEEN